MGLFSSSSSPDLDEVLKESLSPAFRADVVGNRDYRNGLNKLATEQAGLLDALGQGERLQNIVPCMADGYKGIAVLTQNRVFEFKQKIRHQMTLEHVAEVIGKVHPRGYAIISVHGQNYVPYSSGMSNAALKELERNFVQFQMSGIETAKHFIALLNGIRDDPRAAI